MAAFLFRCPDTGVKVQGWVADIPEEGGGATYELVTCAACSRLHLVDPKSGRVLGSEDE